MSAPSLDEQIRSHLETLEAAPGDPCAFEALESLYEQASRWEDLVALYEGRARLVPEPGAPLLAKAATLARTKLRNVARAEELYRQLLHAQPADPGALAALGQLLQDRQDWPGLAAVLERAAAAAAPADAARLTLRLGVLHEERLGRRDRAALLYARACRLDPGLAEARARGVAAFTALRHFAQAKRLLDVARDAGADGASLAAEYAALAARLVDEPLEHGLSSDAVIEALALDRAAPGAAATRERLRAFPRAWRDEVARARGARAAGARPPRGRRAPAPARPAPPRLRSRGRLARARADRPRLGALPGDPAALELLARVHAEKGDHRGVRRRARAARRRRPAIAPRSSPSTSRWRGSTSSASATRRARSPRSAARSTLDPACEPAALQAFEHHADAGRFEEALATLERHLAAAPEKAGARAAPRPRRRARARPARRPRPRRAATSRRRSAPIPATPRPPRRSRRCSRTPAEWSALAQVLEASAGLERDRAERIRLLERLAEVQQERLGRPKEALRTLARALALDPDAGRRRARRWRAPPPARTRSTTSCARTAPLRQPCRATCARRRRCSAGWRRSSTATSRSPRRRWTPGARSPSSTPRITARPQRSRPA